MQNQNFIKRVQERTDLPTSDEAISITRATLETLAEHEAAKSNLAFLNQLPEIGEFVPEKSETENFDAQEFAKRVSRRTGIEDLNAAAQYSSGVLAIIQESVEREDFDKLRAGFPEEFNPLFEMKSTEALSARH